MSCIESFKKKKNNQVFHCLKVANKLLVVSYITIDKQKPSKNFLLE